MSKKKSNQSKMKRSQRVENFLSGKQWVTDDVDEVDEDVGIEDLTNDYLGNDKKNGTMQEKGCFLKKMLNENNSVKEESEKNKLPSKKTKK